MFSEWQNQLPTAQSSEVAILRSETEIPSPAFPVEPGSESIKQPTSCIAAAHPSDSNAIDSCPVRHAPVETTDLPATISAMVARCTL